MIHSFMEWAELAVVRTPLVDTALQTANKSYH
jgi:hypothetical protein